MTREELTRFQAQTLHIAVGMVCSKYEIAMLDDIAKLDVETLINGFQDTIADAMGPLWKALEEDGRAIGDRWGSAADKAYDEKYELWRSATS